MKLRFLLDENLSPRLKAALLRLNPAIDVVRLGDPGAPQLGTPDPDVLRYLEVSQRVLVTSNRKSVCLLTLKPTGQQAGICGDCSGFVRGHR